MQTDSAIAAVTAGAVAVLDAVYFGNTVRVWLIALATFAAVAAALVVIRYGVIRRLDRTAVRTATNVDDYALALLRQTRFVFIGAVALFAALLVVVLPPQARLIVTQLAKLIILLQIGLWANHFVSLYLRRVSTERAAADLASVTAINALAILARLTLWVVVLLLVLANFGVNITALITGLGIGGIALALAVQNILGDLLASLSIVLDKPFAVGDFIIIDTHAGTVEEVGLKTTRVRSLTGEQLIFANGDLLKSRIRNFKRMVERRVVLTFGIEYGTPPDVVEQIPGIVRELIEAEPQTRCDRSHFKLFGAASLDFEAVYYVLGPEYALMMDIQQRLNLALMRRFAAMGVSFAFPTQTLYLRNDVRQAVPS